MKCILCVLALGACALDSTDPASVDEFLPDGTLGVDRVIRHGEEQDLNWVARDGMKYVAEDFSIGPALVKNVELASGQSIGMWPRSIMPYCINDIADVPLGLTVAQQTQLDGELAALAKVTPVKFQRHPCATIVSELAAEGLGPAYVDYILWTQPYNSTGGPVGHAAGWTIQLSNPFGDGSVWHETGHALGYMHEQTRPDRASYVNYYNDCVTAASGATLAQTQAQFTLVPNATDITPYDINSVMEYSSYSFGTYNGNTLLCPPLLFGGTDPANAPVWGTFTKPDNTQLTLRGTLISPPGNWSPEDINGAWIWFEQALNPSHTNDMLGTSMVSADFDGDGYDDLAVGAIGEASPDKSIGGAVLIYKGTSQGLFAWKLLYEGEFGVPTQGSDDFGFSLAAGDVNGDGIADLVVGAPFRGTPQAGAVFIYTGSATGLTKSAGPITQTSLGGTSHASDMFGAAIAIGKFAGSGSKTYIAVGAPYMHPNQNGGSRGQVMLFTMSGGAPSFWTKLDPDAAGIGIDSGMFGDALAAGDLDGNGIDDLVVGAPAINVGTGNVAPFYGKLNATPVAGPLIFPNEALAVGDRYGISLAYNQTKYAIGLAVGASAKAGEGRVYQFGPFNHTIVQYGVYRQDMITDQKGSRGDSFGTTVAIGDIDNDGQNDILVGVSNKTIAGKVGAGEAALFMSNGKASIVGPSTPQTNDRMGTSLAIGNFDAGRKNPVRTDKLLDFAIGIPGRIVNNQTNAGAFNSYKGFPTFQLVWRQFTQDSHTGP